MAWPQAPTLHPLVTSMPAEIDGNIRAMGEMLQRRVADPLERVKAVHDYVADRIAYDGESYVAHRYPPQDVATVMSTRKAVCAGYAAVFRELAQAAGLEAVFVGGDVRKEGGTMAGEGHAWNAVRVWQRWYLVDTTWDSGDLDGSRFTKKYRTDYLMTPPEILGHSHLPDDERWQLRDRPLSRGEFLRQPQLQPGFFAAGLVLEQPDRPQVDVQGELSLRVRSTRGRFVLVDQSRVGSTSPGQRCTVTGREVLDVTCRFPGPGAYKVNIFAGEQQYGSYDGVAAVDANVR
ncbi:MAG: hypothetical protein EOO75_16970 [Myxococcales bacterium]|nr:MAG: hypothetical protein EOO75_16970 [Myxococcales bacterium]